MVTGLCRGCGRMWFWHAFLMVCCHTVESLLMADVRWQVYWVTLVWVGGYAVIMACCRLCSPSVSVWFPQIHCRRVCFVMSVPLVFVSPQLSGSDVIIRFCEAGSVFRASINRGRSGVEDRVCAAGCVGVGYRDG
jgi:hypothetical protein